MLKAVVWAFILKYFEMYFKYDVPNLERGAGDLAESLWKNQKHYLMERNYRDCEFGENTTFLELNFAKKQYRIFHRNKAFFQTVEHLLKGTFIQIWSYLTREEG